MYVFYFFSSRRRHTRYWRDWSSDVCSSDLPDGSTIAFTRPRDPIDGGGFANRDVWVANVDGSNARRVARSGGTPELPAGLEREGGGGGKRGELGGGPDI